MKSYELTKKIILSVEKDKIIGLMYSEAGACGRPGHIEIIDKMNNRYVAETLLDSDVSQGEVLNLLFLNNLNETKLEDMYVDKRRYNGFLWSYIYLGLGNHLLLRDDCCENIINILKGISDDSKKYKKWLELVED